MTAVQPRTLKKISICFGGVLFLAACRGAELRTDIEYAKRGGESLRLDAGVPDGAGPFPMAIIVHGGGWSSGDKGKDSNQGRDISPLFEPLTRANFTWFSINYRMAPTNLWPACLDDVEAAIRWVKAHAGEFKGDANRLALIGHSAGGHLVCMAAVRAGNDTRVQAVVGLAAPTDNVADTQRRGGLSKSLQMLLNRPEKVDEETTRMLQEISPIDFVKPGLPPFLLIQGTADNSVPYSQSVNFQAKLKESGIPCELITITNAPHALTAWEKFDPGYKPKMVEWLQETLKAR